MLRKSSIDASINGVYLLDLSVYLENKLSQQLSDFIWRFVQYQIKAENVSSY